jgi:serine/threonine-protein kinase HipA
LIELGRLIGVSDRIRDEETDEDLQLIFAPGSSLGGALPKASVIDQRGRLAIAKFPKETDEYSVERWEAIALTPGALGRYPYAGSRAARHWRSVGLAVAPLRPGDHRITFLSALSIMGLKDGEHASYPELADVLAQQGASTKEDAAELFRRMAFNVLVSNVDDHLRNHGFLRARKGGWVLSPAYDLNPTPADVRPRILTTAVGLDDDGTYDTKLVLSVAGYFGLSQAAAKSIVKGVAETTPTWRRVPNRMALAHRKSAGWKAPSNTTIFRWPLPCEGPHADACLRCCCAVTRRI